MQCTHGLLMYLGWGFCIPFGFLFARYGKQFPDALWFEVHRFAMTIGFLLVLSGLGVAFTMIHGHFHTVWHAQLGIAVVAGMLFQVSSGILKPHNDEANKTRIRKTFELTHHIIGRLSIISAWVAIFSGLLILPAAPVFLYLHAVLIFFWLLAASILEVRARIKQHRENYELVNAGARKK